jgi:hypothetical protein
VLRTIQALSAAASWSSDTSDNKESPSGQAGGLLANASGPSHGDNDDDDAHGGGRQGQDKLVKESVGIWGRWIVRLGLAKLDRDTVFFSKNVHAEPMYTPADAHDTVAFHTASSWSLGQLCCLSSDQRYATHVVQGEGAVSKEQWTNALYFVYVCCALVVLGAAGFLVFLRAPVGVVVVAVAVLLPCLAHFASEMRVVYFSHIGGGGGGHARGPGELPSFAPRRKNRDGISGAVAETDDKGIKAVLMRWKTERILRIKDRVCDVLVLLMVIMLFVVPLVALLFIDAIALAMCFVVLSVFAALRFFADLRSVLKEVGVAGVIAPQRGHFCTTRTIPRCNCKEPSRKTVVREESHGVLEASVSECACV